MTPLSAGPPIKVICTDKRQHKAMRLGRGPGEYVDGRLRAACPGCLRDYGITAERFAAIVASCLAAGMTELDLSALPQSRRA